MKILYFVFLFFFVGIICWLWVSGINKMKEEHPEYKGEDFLEWDDNKIHTEGKI